MLCQLHLSSQHISPRSLLPSVFALPLQASAFPSIFMGLTPITVGLRFGDSRVCYSKTVQSWFLQHSWQAAAFDFGFLARVLVLVLVKTERRRAKEELSTRGRLEPIRCCTKDGEEWLKLCVTETETGYERCGCTVKSTSPSPLLQAERQTR